MTDDDEYRGAPTDRPTTWPEGKARDAVHDGYFQLVSEVIHQSATVHAYNECASAILNIAAQLVGALTREQIPLTLKHMEKIAMDVRANLDKEPPTTVN